MARGRLICPFVAVFNRYDHVATAQDPVFRSPVVNPDGTQSGQSSRIDRPLRFPVQVSLSDEFERLRDRASGNDPISQMRLVAHFRDLENLGLVYPTTGLPDVLVQDELVEMRTRGTDDLVMQVPEVPGLVVHEVNPRGWGLSLTNPRRNLLFITLRGRDRSVR